MEGKVKWRIKYENGQVNEIVPVLLYVPSSTHWLLCPHHWAQQVKDNYTAKHGTGCSKFDDVCEMFWDQRQYKSTINWDPKSNIAIISSALGFKKFHVCAAILDAKQTFEHNNVCMQSLNVIPRYKEEEVPPLLPPRDDDKEDYIPILLDQVWESEVESDPHNTQDLQNIQFETDKDALSMKAIPVPTIIEYDQYPTYEDS